MSSQALSAKAMKILKDKIQAYDIPIEAPPRALLVVNMSAAQKTGVYPPLTLMRNADMINIPEKKTGKNNYKLRDTFR